MPVKLLIIQQSAQKRLQKLPLHIHKKVIRSLALIQQNPLVGVKLHGELASYYKYRIGDYRIVYTFNVSEDRLEVVKIEHRQGVYK